MFYLSCGGKHIYNFPQEMAWILSQIPFSSEFGCMGMGGCLRLGDFLARGTRRAVDRALARLTQDRTIRRLAQGLYDYPRVHKKLGILAPNPDDVAAVLAAKTGSRVQISGARSANLLGLSDQVPAQLVYLTDGPGHRVKIGAQTIQLKPARPSRFPGAGTPGRAGSPGDPRGRAPCQQRLRGSTVVPGLERPRPCTTLQANETRPSLES